MFFSIKEFVNQYKPSEILGREEFAELKNNVEAAFLATSEAQPGEPMDEEVQKSLIIVSKHVFNWLNRYFKISLFSFRLK